MQKPKLTIQEQIKNMKKNGITFIACPEKQVTEFLCEHSYYFKIKAYAKCFRKYLDLNNEKYNTYIKLDFNQLIIFSRIDMKLRECILYMALEIEHALKVFLNKIISENTDEDGYETVHDFIERHKKLKEKIESILKHTSSNPYVYTLVEKYHDEFASWNLVEILTFGDLISFYEFYCQKHQVQSDKNITNLLRYVKFLRNAAAYNNCLLNQLGVNEFRIKPSKNAITLLHKNIKTITKKRYSKPMCIPVLHDFAVSIMVFVSVVKSKNAYTRIISLLKDFISLIEKERPIFTQELNIISGFNFLKELIHLLIEKA